MKKRHFLVAALLILGAFGVGAGTKIHTDFFELSKNLDIFGNLYKQLNTYYVDELDHSRMMRTGIEAMLADLDPYTNFYGESDIDEAKLRQSGQYGDVAAVFELRDGKFIVTEPFRDIPGDDRGLMAGDIIVRVDETALNARKYSLQEVRELMRGESGSFARLTIRRPGIEEPIVVNVPRQRADRTVVPYAEMLGSGIGYVVLTEFSPTASSEVKQAIDKLRGQGTLTGLVLDLRGNPGGLLGEAVKICNFFVPTNTPIVEMRGKGPSISQSFATRFPPLDLELPVAVLIDEGSASASEIVSGGLQDLDRAVIIGQQSFGKGLVQRVYPLSFNTQMKITVAKYYTPSGRCIQAIDYSHRNADGSRATLPDSLRTAFKTKAGRTVYDGAGIEPDVEVEKPDLAPVTRALQRQGLIFDFATQFQQQNASIAEPGQFALDPSVYPAFVSFVEKKNFSYTPPTEAALEAFAERVANREDAASFREDIATMRRKIAEQKRTALATHRAEISGLIKEEITRRYYDPAGMIQASLAEDADVRKAQEVLRDAGRYQAILRGE